MGKHSVTLRQPARPHLRLEAFEDRALLSSGRGLTSLIPHWLNTNQLRLTFDPRSIEIFAPERMGTPSQAEAQGVNTDSNAADTEELSQVEQPSEDSSIHSVEDGTEGSLNSENSSFTDGDLSDQTNSNAEETGNTTGSEENESTRENSGTHAKNTDEQPPSEAGREDRREQAVSILRDKLETKDGTDSVRAALLESPLPDPVVVRVLKEYASERSTSDSPSGNSQGNLLSPTTSDSVSAGEELGNHFESRELAAVRQPIGVPSQETTTGESASSRLPGVSRSPEARLSAPVDRDAGLVGHSDQTVSPLRMEGQATEIRAQDTHAPVLPLTRQTADTNVAARGQETADARPALALSPATAEHTAVVGFQRGEATIRSAQIGTNRLLPQSGEAAVEGTSKAGPETTETQFPVVAIPLGILDLAVFVPHMSGLLDGIVPFDREAVQVAVQQLLAQVDDLGGDAASWLAQLNLSPWVVAVAVGLTACDVVRRRQQQAQRGLVLTDEDGTPLTWFPGLAGLWTMQDA